MPDCPNIEKNKQACSCPYESCDRNGICCECIRYHRERGEKPMCVK